MVDFSWKAPDGEQFPARAWGPGIPPRAVIACLHGMGGSVGDFDPFGAFLAQRGFACAAVTLRGQGLDPDPQRRGYWFDAEEAGEDFAAFASEMAQDFGCPRLFVCGESLGALVVSHRLATAGIEGIVGAIFSAPVVGLARETPAIARWGLRWLARVLPRGRLRPAWFVTGGPSPPATSRDKAWVEAQRSGPHSIPAFGFAVLDAVGGLIQSMPATAPAIEVPSLVLAAGKDVFVKPQQISDWFGLLGSGDKTLKVYNEAFHVLWNDWDREVVLADIADWLEGRTPPGG